MVNTLWIQAPNLLLGFLLAIILNRLLGPEGKGMYSIFDSTARFLLTLLGFNLGAAIIYFRGSGKLPPAFLERTLWRYLLLVLALATLAGSLLFAWNPRGIFFPSQLAEPNMVSYYMLWTTLAVAEYLFRSVLHSEKRIDRANVILLLVKGIRLLAMVGLLLWFSGWSKPDLVRALLVLNTCQIGLSALLMAWQARIPFMKQHLFGAFAWRPLLPMVRYAAYLQLGALCQFLNYKFDHWVIFFFLDDAALGHYSAATDLAQMIWLPSNLALLLLFPYLSDTHISGRDKHKLFAVFARAVCTITLGAVLVVLVSADFLMVGLFGYSFAEGAASLRILIVGMGLLNLARTHTVWLTSTNQTLYVFYATGIALCCTVVFSLLLIPRFGIEGAAWSTTLAFLAMTAYHLWISRVKFGVPLRATWIFTYRDWQELRRLLDTVR